MVNSPQQFDAKLRATIEKKVAGNCRIDIKEGLSYSLVRLVTHCPLGATRVSHIRKDLENITLSRVKIELFNDSHFEFEIRNPIPRNLKIQKIEFNKAQIYLGQDIAGLDYTLSLGSGRNIFAYDNGGLLINSLIYQNGQNASPSDSGLLLVSDRDIYCHDKKLAVVGHDALLCMDIECLMDYRILLMDISDSLLFESCEHVEAILNIMQRGKEEGLTIILCTVDPAYIPQTLLAFCSVRIVGRVDKPSTSISLLDSDYAYWLCGESEVCVSAPEFEKVIRLELPS